MPAFACASPTPCLERVADEEISSRRAEFGSGALWSMRGLGGVWNSGVERSLADKFGDPSASLLLSICVIGSSQLLRKLEGTFCDRGTNGTASYWPSTSTMASNTAIPKTMYAWRKHRGNSKPVCTSLLLIDFMFHLTRGIS